MSHESHILAYPESFPLSEFSFKMPSFFSLKDVANVKQDYQRLVPTSTRMHAPVDFTAIP